MKYVGIFLCFFSIFPVSIFATHSVLTGNRINESTGSEISTASWSGIPKKGILYNASLGDIGFSGNTNFSSDSLSSLSKNISLSEFVSDVFSGDGDLSSFSEEIQESLSQFFHYMRDLLNPFWSIPDSQNESFWIQFSIPVSNSGTTDIFPTGRIEIFDDGNKLSAISVDPIDQRIIDYLPINTEEISILSESTWVFQVDWKWFAYHESIDDKSPIDYHSVQEMYTQTHIPDGFIWPWEKMWVQENTKTFHAQITLDFPSENQKLLPLRRSVDIPVQYESSIKVTNYWFISLIFLLFLFCIIQKKRKWTIKKFHKKSVHLKNELDELEKGKILAEQLIEKKSLKKSASSKETFPPIKRTRRKKELPVDVPLEAKNPSNPVKSPRKKPVQKSETPTK